MRHQPQCMIKCSAREAFLCVSLPIESMVALNGQPPLIQSCRECNMSILQCCLLACVFARIECVVVRNKRTGSVPACVVVGIIKSMQSTTGLF